MSPWHFLESFRTKHYIQNFGSFGLFQNNIVNCDTNTYVFFVHDLGWQVLDLLFSEMQFPLK